MNEETPPLPTTESETKLTSEQFDEFNEALEVLYLIANISGRNHFTKDWPQAAAYLFGEQLIHFDEEGAKDEAAREKRAELEVQAEERRLALLETLDGIEEKSVQSGVLQTEHVKSVVEELGRELALHVYSAQIVDRFIPPPPKPKSEEREEGQAGEAVAAAAVEAVPEVQPIDVGDTASSSISEPVQPEQASAAIASPPAPVSEEPVVSEPVSTVSEAPAITPMAPESEIKSPPVQPSESPVQELPSAPPSPPVEPPVESPSPVSPPAPETPNSSLEAQTNQGDAPNTQRAVSMKFVPSKKEDGEDESGAEKPPEGA